MDKKKTGNLMYLTVLYGDLLYRMDSVQGVMESLMFKREPCYEDGY